MNEEDLTETQIAEAELELATTGEYSGTADCEVCHGRRIARMHSKRLCESCYEDGGPHAGETDCWDGWR